MRSEEAAVISGDVTHCACPREVIPYRALGIARVYQSGAWRREEHFDLNGSSGAERHKFL